MEANFLQEFLKTGLFDIGEVDARLEYLESSISDLQKKFKDDLSLLPKYTLVALDPKISEDEPALIETERIVTEHWKALRSKGGEMPRNLHRGVILNSLYNVGMADPTAARIIVLTGSNYFPYAKLGNELKLAERLLFDLGEIAEKDAIEEWSFNEEEPTLKLGTLKVSGLKFNQVNIVGTKYRERFREGAGTITVNNYQQQPQQNWEVWMNQISDGARDGVVELLKTTFEQFSKSVDISSVETSINDFFKGFKKSLDENLKLSFASLTAVERRSKLLWWKETLYSQSLHKSYRKIEEPLLPIVMGFDLYHQLPEITPVSVDYLLRDSLLMLKKSDEKIQFSQYFDLISKTENCSIIKPFFENPTDVQGRIPIIDFIGLFVHERIEIKDFFERTGVKETETISFGDLSISVLHDLLTQRLITT